MSVWILSLGNACAEYTWSGIRRSLSGTAADCVSGACAVPASGV